MIKQLRLGVYLVAYETRIRQHVFESGTVTITGVPIYIISGKSNRKCLK